MIWIPGGINTGADADEDIDETDSKKADESSKHHQTMFDIQDYMADFDHDASVVYPMDAEYEPLQQTPHVKSLMMMAMVTWVKSLQKGYLGNWSLGLLEELTTG